MGVWERTVEIGAGVKGTEWVGGVGGEVECVKRGVGGGGRGGENGSGAEGRRGRIGMVGGGEVGGGGWLLKASRRVC